MTSEPTRQPPPPADNLREAILAERMAAGSDGLESASERPILEAIKDHDPATGHTETEEHLENVAAASRVR